jgi:CPA1 family monovalent cation:H+ antiporter
VLHIADPSEAEFEKQETAKAQKISQEASREVIEKFVADPPPGVDPEILSRFQQMATRQERDDSEAIQARKMGAAFMDLRQEMLTAQREAIVRERNEGRLDDDVARTVIEQLDYQEAASFANRVDRL